MAQPSPAAAPSTVPAAAPAQGLDRLVVAATDIKLSHSIFALPFAVLGAFLALPAPGTPAPTSGMLNVEGWTRVAVQLTLVVVCMVFARTWAMLINRIADWRLDAMNPRTARRAVASGKLARTDAIAMAVASAIAFCLCCAAFWNLLGNPWPTYLCIPVLAWLAVYSYAKRFTLFCHVLLGSALAISPIAAAIAIDPAALTRTPAIFTLAAMVACWVAGFDIIYALQDEHFDRHSGLHSIPAALGPRRSAWISRSLHILAIAALLATLRLDPRLGLIFAAGVALAAGLLVLEHVVLHRRGLAGLPMAFFTINGVVSCVVGAAGVADLTLG